MKRSRAAFGLAGLFAVSALLTTTSLVLASYQWYCWTWEKSTIGTHNHASGYWGTIINSEFDEWDAGTCIDFTAGSELHGDANFYGNTGWLGLARILQYNGCQILQAEALLNRTYLDGANYPEADDRHTTCQEIGHTLGLIHRKGGQAQTCMNDGFAFGPFPDFDAHDAEMVGTINCGAVDPVCGDGNCDPGEDSCNCQEDCGGTCGCGGKKASCSQNSDCCSNNCKNGSCKGN